MVKLIRKRFGQNRSVRELLPVSPRQVRERRKTVNNIYNGNASICGGSNKLNKTNEQNNQQN